MHTIPEAKADQGARSTCRSSRCSRSRAGTAGRGATCFTLVRQQLHDLDFTDDQIDGGGLRVDHHPDAEGDGRSAAGRVCGQTPKRPQAAARRGGDRPARHRGAARLLRRPGLPAVADQLGRGRRHGRLDVQAGLARGGDHRRLLAEEHLGRATRRTPSPTVSRSTTRASGTGTNYGSAISSVTAMEESVNTAFVDMSASMKDGPQKILDDGATRWGSRQRPGPALSGHPQLHARPRRGRADHVGQGHGSARSTWPTPTPRSPTAASAQTSTSSTRSPTAPARCCYQYKPHTTEAIRPDIDRDVSYAMQQVVLHGTGTERPGDRSPGRRQDRHRHQRQRRRLVVLVRRIHPAAGDRGDVRPRRRRQRAQRLAAAVQRCGRLLRRRLPDGHLGRGHAARPRRRAGGVVPAGGQRAGQARPSHQPPPPPPPPTPPHHDLVGTDDVERADQQADLRRPRPRRPRRRRRAPTSQRPPMPAGACPAARPTARSHARRSARPVVMASREPWW